MAGFSSHQHNSRFGNISFKYDDIHESMSRMELVKVVQCINCQEIPIRPVFSCKNGHIVCGSCRALNPLCANCQSQVTDTRNRVAETIISSFIFKCKNRAEGCPQLIPWKNIVQHLKHDCEFRPVPCDESLRVSCGGALIPYASYLGHLKDGHHIRKFRVLDNLSRSIHCNSLSQNCSWPLFCLAYDDKTFFQNIHLQNSTAYIWITVFGPLDAEFDAYMATVTLRKETDPRLKTALEMKMTMPVQCFRKTFDEVKSEGMFLALTKEQLIAFSIANMRDEHDTTVYKYSWTLYTNISKCP